MSLEDFFTLTEMKDGLATLARVEELLSVMQSHKDCDPNNLADAARQWVTVANILAATENNDCLNHFVRLNGLSFLNHWLQEAQKWNENNSDCSVEELIKALLGALDRLPIDKEKSSASGIASTIKQLCCRSHNIRERLRNLFSRWGHEEDSDLKCQNVEKQGTSGDDESKPSLKRSIAENVQSINPGPDASPTDEGPGDNAKGCSNSSSADTAKNVKHLSTEIPFHQHSNSSDVNAASGEINSYPCQESLFNESVCPAAGVASTGTRGSLTSRGKTSDAESDISSGKDASDNLKELEIEVNMEECSPCTSAKKDPYTVSRVGTLFHKDDIGTTVDLKEVDGNPKLKISKVVGSVTSHASLKPEVDASMSEMDRISEIGLGYGDMDALEIARQVAIEVEREVADYGEPFCSSPEGISEGKSLYSSSPDTENNINKPMSEQLNENESPGKHNSEDSPRDRQGASENVDGEDLYKPESPKSSLVQESASHSEKGKYEFDLNVDVFPEEPECPIVSTSNQNIKVSTPILVAASKGTPVFPVTPYHFQGIHGWRGSAATSAFRPASPWRTSDGEKTVSGPKQKPLSLRIDLNVAEGEDDIAADQLEKQTPASSSIPSRESSMEVSSRRAEKMKLDLNRIGDEDTLPNVAPFWRPHLHNPNLSLSPASSSSSRQPSTRDFDLNDNPLFDASCSNSHSKSSKEATMYGSYMADDSVVTIMGSRMPVEREALVNETRQAFFGNGMGMNPVMNVRGPVPYPPMPPPAFGYNGLVMGPAISIPPTFCGPGSIPYIVDSRGPSVIPQMLGSVGLSGAPSARAPFVMSVGGAPPGLNMVGVSRPGLDLNSGSIIPSEGEGRAIGGLKQFFVRGNSGLMEEVRSVPESAGSGMALKRKEPDCGWESCTFGYKQRLPDRRSCLDTLHVGLRNGRPVHVEGVDFGQGRNMRVGLGCPPFPVIA